MVFGPMMMYNAPVRNPEMNFSGGRNAMKT
jgi:hypothetical protein